MNGSPKENEAIFTRKSTILFAFRQTLATLPPQATPGNEMVRLLQ
jgi:hypothetical protein